MLGGVNTVAQQLAQVYGANNQKLAEVLSRIASGKKVRQPGDDFAGYTRARQLETEVGQYGAVKADLAEARGVAQLAAEAGEGLYEDITRMKSLVGLWWDAAGDADAQASYKAEFDALKAAIQDTLDNTKYDGRKVVDAAFSYTVATDPQHSGQIDISYAAADILSAGALTIGSGSKAAEQAAVSAEIAKAAGYLEKSDHFVTMIERQSAMTDTIIQSKQSVITLITDIDEAQEMSNATEMNIRQKASVAMLAQANMLHAAVGRLYSSGAPDQT
jgi:flagellin